MHATTNPLSILFVTDESIDQETVRNRLGVDDGVRVSLTTTAEATTQASTAVDCLIYEAPAAQHECLDTVRALRSVYPSTPVVVFTGDHDGDTIDQLFQAGATDVVQSSLESAPVSLVRTRLDGVLDETVLAGHGQTLEQYETILNTAADAIYQLDSDGHIVAVNDAAVELTGYERSELVGSHVSKFFDADTISRGQRLIQDQLDSEQSTVETLEMDLQTKRGETVPCKTRIAVLTADGELTGSVGVVRDIREEKERERELRKHDELLRSISENISDVVWVISPQQDEMEFVSDAYEEVWGRPKSELYEHPRSFLDGIHPADRAAVREAQTVQQEHPEQYDETYRVVQPDGEIRWVHDRAFGVYEDGSLERIVGVAQDITERKQAQQQLEAERDMFAEGPAVVFKWKNEAGWPVEYVSENVESVLGYTPEQLESGEVSYTDLLLDEESDRIEREVSENSDGTTERFSHDPYRLRTKQGDVRWVTDTTKIVRDGDEITHYLGYIVDITERKEREQALQAERDLIERIFDTSPVGIAVVDAEGDIVQFNDRAVEIFGLSAEEITNRSHDDKRWNVYDGDGTPIPPDEFPASRVLDTGESVYGWETVVERPDGERVWVVFDGKPLLDESGTVSRAVLAIQDVTERKRQTEKIEQQRDELAQLDRLNAVIRDVDQALVGAASRTEIENLVCEQLTESGHYEFALSLQVDTTGHLELNAWADVGSEYVENAFPIENVSAENSPGIRAVETGDVQTNQHLSAVSDPVPWQEAALAAGIESAAAIPVVHGDRAYGIISVYDDEPDAFSERELDVLGELGETVGHAIAAVEHREREQTLTSLYEATRALLGVETQEAVSDVVVDTAEEVLGLSGVGVFLFDNSDNTLRPASATETLLNFYGESTVFGPGNADSETWQSYVSGERKFFSDIRDSERVVNPDTDARATLIIPLGDHGVFVAAATEVGAFDEQKQKLVGLLAATTEAALDRVAGQADIEQRDEELQLQTQQLDQLQQVVDFLRDIDRILLDAGTREEIERGVCDRLTRMDPYAFAWIGTVPPDGDRVEPQTWAKTDNGYLDGVSLALSGSEPAVETATSGSVTAVSNSTDHLRDSDWAQVAIDCGYQSVVAVPLAHGETSYGVLAVYANQPEAFDDLVTSVLAELGETIAYSINAVETRRGVLSDRVTELELRIESPDTFLNAVAAVADQSVTYREILPEGGGSARVLFALEDPDIEAILALESEFVAVQSLSHVERCDEHLFRATLSGQTVAATLLKCGGIPETVVASPDETTAVVRLPRELDVRVFLDRVKETYPATELLSRRDTEGSRQDRTDIRTILEEELTERQREVLLTAYESGFFESPRETTGAELADLLDISQPTVTHHLREAQRRLFSALYEDEP